jgi:AcrR family transcriptional regulator
LLETARKLFIENGFHQTGVAQIASASGVRVGQIYRDFDSKEDIIAEIARRDLGNFLDEKGLEQAIARHDMAAIRAWILSFVSYEEDLEGYRLIPEIMAESARNARIADVQEEMRDRVRSTLAKALSACAPGEEHARARVELAELIATIGGGLCNWVVSEQRRGRDPRPLCARLGTIVARELDALCDAGAPITVA